MRYCIFIANFLPNLGGVERYTYNLGKKLIQKGHHVTVITSNVFHLQEHEIVEGIEVFRIPCFNLLGGRFPVLKPSSAFFRMHRHLKTLNFDFAIIQSRFYVHCAYGIHYAKTQHLPRLVLEHGTNHFTVNNPVLDWAGSLYEHAISKYIQHNCQYFYGVSQACCQWLKHFHIEASGQLYNAIDSAEIQLIKQAPPVSYRQQFDLGNRPIVTFTGRLVKEKGIQKLLQAIDILHQKDIDATLMVAGNGDLYQQLQAQNPTGVHLLGLLDFPQVISLLSESEIFCLPTDYPEGFPTSVLEAAACGCYIITTNKGGSQELILQDDYGVILTENTPERIAKAIEQAILQPEHRNAAAKKAQQRALDLFTWDAISSKVIQISESLIKENMHA